MISPEDLAELTAEPIEAEAERAPEPMDDDEFNATVRRLVENARQIMEEEVLPALEMAWRYYNGGVKQSPMGLIGIHEETGEKVYEGSSAVLTECADQVQTLIPDIYEVLAGSEEAIKFQPNEPSDTAHTEQVNDYMRHLFWDRNNGEELIKDGLLEWCVKFAAYRVWREHSYREHVRELDELSETALFVLRQDSNVEIEELEAYQRDVPAAQPLPDGGLMHINQPVTMYRVRCRYFEPYGKTRIELVPQDELLVDLEAQTLDEATVLGIDAERRVTDLIAMGLDPDDVKRMAGKGLRRGIRSTDIRRERAGVDPVERTYRDNIDEALSWVRTVDARVMVDRNRDGIAEAWRVIALGEPLEVVSAVEDPGSDTIVVGSPFPRPHRVIGDGIVENSMDLQEIGTSVVRRTLDNFARAINPRMVIKGGDEAAFDAAQSWFGGAIPLPMQSDVEWLQVPFNGAAALPLLEYFENRRVLRTGISPASQGLDPGALKGQTLDAVAAVMSGPQNRVKGYAREFALRILRNLFKAALRITVAYQDKPEIIRLRNKFVEVDPSAWNPDLDVAVEVGLGTGSRLERMIASNQIIQKQEQLALAGSPLFDLKKYRQALADLTHALGTKDDERYFPELDDEKMAEMQAKAEQEKQQQMQQAVQMEGAVEQAKAAAQAQAEIAVEQAKAQLEAAARERELALEGEMERRLLEIEQMWKERLLRVEAALEQKLMQSKTPPAGAQGNVQRRA